MAKFRCMVSKTIVEFTLEHDIKAMREHPQYEEVVEQEVVEVEPTLYKRGRKPKELE